MRHRGKMLFESVELVEVQSPFAQPFTFAPVWMANPQFGNDFRFTLRCEIMKQCGNTLGANRTTVYSHRSTEPNRQEINSQRIQRSGKELSHELPLGDRKDGFDVGEIKIGLADIRGRVRQVVIFLH